MNRGGGQKGGAWLALFMNACAGGSCSYCMRSAGAAGGSGEQRTRNTAATSMWNTIPVQ